MDEYETNLSELRSPSAARRSNTPFPSLRPSTFARSCTTLATSSSVYESVLTIRHLQNIRRREAGTRGHVVQKERKALSTGLYRCYNRISNVTYRSSRSTGMPCGATISVVPRTSELPRLVAKMTVGAMGVSSSAFRYVKHSMSSM